MNRFKRMFKAKVDRRDPDNYSPDIFTYDISFDQTIDVGYWFNYEFFEDTDGEIRYILSGGGTKGLFDSYSDMVEYAFSNGSAYLKAANLLTGKK